MPGFRREDIAPIACVIVESTPMKIGATHLLDAGVDLHTIKELLGHSKIETTMVYLHLQKCKRAKLTSPFDRIIENPKENGERKH